MAAKDYTFQAGWMNLYLAKKTKSKTTMSQDRRVIEDNECIAIAEWWLRKRVKELKSENPNASNTVEIRNSEGKVLFDMTLHDYEPDNEEEEEDNEG